MNASFQMYKLKPKEAKKSEQETKTEEQNDTDATPSCSYTQR